MTEIKHIAVLSLAKIFAAVSLVVGLIIGIIALLLGGVATLFMGSYAPQAAMGVAGGVIAIIVMTIGAAVVGFIYGAIIAFIYNIAAGWFGGIEIELE
ncbi:hypothetical protein [Methanoplanus endosymbiosus]|uniref:DUF3566 domain-containing protein n=1 Tax=Methanoplanus endosymbiosus TaxID=33865 RepID=A0A9E7TKJ2_9EURY|nr:hypothetical protein [Methanoplanus endosymbiosus]UUX92685.1 hypothetical protein L6E24_00730 [Methanoplanus endosymbiosus]